MKICMCGVCFDRTNKKDVFSFLTNINLPVQTRGFCTKEKRFMKTFPELYEEFKKINWSEILEFKVLLWHFLQNDYNLSLGKCKRCGKRCNFKRFSSGYSDYCCRECVYLDENARKKISESILNRSAEYKKEIQEKVKYTKLKRYGFENYNNREKFKKTCIEKYGVNNVFQNEDIKEKIKNTNLKKYGVENPFQSEEIKEKIKEVNFEKYGTEHPMLCEDIKEKQRNSMFERFNGQWNSQTDEWIDKVHKTKFEKYGNENFNNREQAKNTCIEKYGVENYSQTVEFSSKRRKRIKYNNLMFDSSWEVEVYMYCKENKIDCVYQPKVSFEYFYDGKKHRYHPDFLINGKLYEVKGDHFFDGDKMICPYNRNDYMDGLFEAKHQCMLKNGVIILRKSNLFEIK